MESNKIISNKNRILEGPFEIIPKTFKDKRGYFFESFNQKEFNNQICRDILFVQDNQSRSLKNVLRGLHYQIEPFGQGKLVRVLKGIIYDVIVDLRYKSSTFGEWAGIELNDKKQNQLWVPIGYAHGFLTISDYAIVQYKTTNYWSSSHEKSLLWSDEDLNIQWQNEKYADLGSPILSEKDAKGLSLKEIKAKGDIF